MRKKRDKKYKYVHAPEHPRAKKNGQMLEHVLVMEEKIGRYLKKNEVVHHIDENKLNNSPDNLMLFATTGDHTAYHKGAEIYEENGVWYAKKRLAFDENGKKIHTEPDKYYICEYCGKQFNSYKTKSQKIYKHIYCSVECRNKAQETIPDATILQKMLIEHNGDFGKLAKDLKTDTRNIHRKLKRANLPYLTSDYK